jgi:Fur family transcriptional regulator, ferric uptake regulator
MKKVPLEELVISLLERNHLLAAPDMLVHLQEAGHRYNKTSLYRALDRMLEENQLCKHSFGSNQIYYELRDHHHDHLVCTTCGKVEATHSLLSPTLTIKSFTVDHTHVTVFGTCAQCQPALS